MLYEAYQVHNDVLGPIRLMAEAFRGFLNHPWPLVGNAPCIRRAAAAMEHGLAVEAMGLHRVRGAEHAGSTEGAMDPALVFLDRQLKP